MSIKPQSAQSHPRSGLIIDTYATPHLVSVPVRPPVLSLVSRKHRLHWVNWAHRMHLMHDGRLPADRDHYFDGLRVNRRFMGDVIFITKEQLKRVHPERQGDLRLGLARSEMEVIGVAGNGLIERRQRRIDQEVVMAGIVLFKARRRDTHAYQPKPYGRRLGHVAAIGGIFEIDLRIWGRSMASTSPCGPRAVRPL